MSWQPEADEIERRRAFAHEHGGEEGVRRQRALGKLTARERIELLFDAGSFQELGTLAGQASYSEDGKLQSFRAANSVVGKGLVGGRKALVCADDFTNRGGSSETQIAAKWIYPETYALEMGLPMVRLVETSGGSVRLLDKNRAPKIPGYSTLTAASMLEEVPVAAIALGACAGLGAFKVSNAHFSVMVKEISHVFAAGPPVVKAALGRDLSKEELGGWRIHAQGSGVVDNVVDTEQEGIAQIRRWLSYMPSNAHQLPPVTVCDDPSDRREESLLTIIPREKRVAYDMRRILSLVFDKGSLFEIGRGNGPSQITSLARLAGRPVGVLANDCRHSGGAMTLRAAQKMETFIDICDSFHIPVVNFVDQPGVMIGEEAERAGTIRAAIRALAAIEQSRVPWVAIIVRRLFGVAGTSYGRLQGLNLHYAWPSARWGSIPLEGGIAAAYRRELEASPDPSARLRELEAHYARYESPFLTAEQFGVPEMIDPRDTRRILCDWVAEAYDVLPRQLGPVRRGMRR